MSSRAPRSMDLFVFINTGWLNTACFSVNTGANGSKQFQNPSPRTKVFKLVLLIVQFNIHTARHQHLSLGLIMIINLKGVYQRLP